MKRRNKEFQELFSGVKFFEGVLSDFQGHERGRKSMVAKSKPDKSQEEINEISKELNKLYFEITPELDGFEKSYENCFNKYYNKAKHFEELPFYDAR